MKRRLFFTPLLVLSLAGLGCKTTQKPTESKAPEVEQYELGMTAIKGNRPEDARGNFETAIRLNPSFAPAYIALSEMYSQLGDNARAVEELEMLRKAAPSAPHVLCRLSELYGSSGLFLRAADLAQRAVQQEPECPLAQVQQALVFEGTGQLGLAISSLEKARKLSPKSETVILALAQSRARSGAASDAWNDLAALPEKPELRAQASYVRGWLTGRYGNGKPDPAAALPLLDTALKEQPKYPAALQEKGHTLVQLGRLDEALPLLQQAVKQSGSSAELFTDLGTIYSKQNKPEGAALKTQAAVLAREEVAYKAARKRYLESPEDVKNTLALALLEANHGSVSEAQRLVVDVLKKDPNNTEALALVNRFMLKDKKN